MFFSPMKNLEVKEASTFEEWMSLHKEEMPFVNVLCKKEDEDLKAFKEKRETEHHRIKKVLPSMYSKLAKIQERIDAEIQNTEKRFNRLDSPKLYYTDSESDMTIRKFLFLKREFNRRSLDCLTSYLNEIYQRLRYVKFLYELVTSICIPDDKVVTLSNDFFVVKPNELEMQRTNGLYLKCLDYQKVIRGYKLPLYIKNPKSFFNSLREEALKKADKENLYFDFLESEIGFSIYLFRSQCVEGKKIDEFIIQQEEVQYINFGEEVLKLCYHLIPPLSNPNEKAIAISLFFRQIMERAYERFYKTVPVNKKIVEFLAIVNKPMKDVLPVTCGTPFPPETPVKVAFLFDPLIKEAVQELLYASFVVNVIDSLHYVSKSLEMIQSASVISILQREPTKEEVRSFVGFEETFSLLLGAVLSSDIPDIFQYASMVKRMAPMSMLSPEIEFAATNIIAILDHLLMSA